LALIPSEHDRTRVAVRQLRDTFAKQSEVDVAQAVANFIYNTESAAGSRFLVVDGRPCLFTAITRQLLDIGGNKRWNAHLFAIYGINTKEKFAAYVTQCLESHCVWNGEEREARRWVAFVDGVLHISNYDGYVWRVTGAGVVIDPDTGRVTDDGWGAVEVEDENGSTTTEQGPPIGIGIEPNGSTVVFADDDEGKPVASPAISKENARHLFKMIGSVTWDSTPRGMLPKHQTLAVLIWVFAIAFPDLFPTKPLLIVEGAAGGGKCLGPGVKVLKFDGTIVRADQVKIGDLLMGPDSKPRKVLGTTRGVGPMFRIKPVKGEPWTCNDAHVLTLVGNGRQYKDEIVDIALDEYLTRGPGFAKAHKLFQPDHIEFSTAAAPKVDPYFLGVWFGDGTKGMRARVKTQDSRLTGIRITKPDPEIEAICRSTAKTWGLNVSRFDNGPNCPTWCLVGVRGKPNRLTQTLQTLVGENLNIPQEILVGSDETRAAFLAGLLDTDGYLHHGFFEIVQKREDYAEAIAFIARSLGLRVTHRLKFVNGNPYHRLQISGHVDRIPTRISRKQAVPRKQIKNALRSGFSTEAIGEGPYAGFQLDGDGRFLLGDFTVTHNSSIFQLLQIALRGIMQPLIVSENGEKDFRVSLLRTPVAVLDNTDDYIKWLPNALAAYATGGGWVDRELFTNQGVVKLRPQAFIAVASKNPVSFRADDVADRSIVLRTARRKDALARRAMRKMQVGSHIIQPKPNTRMDKLKNDALRLREQIFGGWLYHLNRIVAVINSGGLPETAEHRMADWEAFTWAVARAFNWDDHVVVELLEILQRERTAFASENDTVVELVEEWLDRIDARTGISVNEGRWITQRDLYKELKLLAELGGKAFVKSPMGMVHRLRSPHVVDRFYVDDTRVDIKGEKLYWISRQIALASNDGGEGSSDPQAN